MREVIKTGKTVDEATSLALAELGLAEEDVTIEVLELPQKKLFKTIPAKVRVTVDEEEPVVVQPAPKAEPAARPARPVQPEAAAAPKPTPTSKPAPQKQDKPAEKAAAPKREITPFEPFEEAVLEPVDMEANLKVKEAVEYLIDICAKMGVGELAVVPYHQGESILLKVEGADAGSLIGHRGEVMESLSYLTGLVANRSGGDYLKFNLDINHYRSKREANLVALAQRIGAKVAKTGRSHTLEPMNPYERRIIHSAVGEIENVKSESTGEGANRRVVILCTGENARADRPFRQAGRGGKPAGRPDQRDGRPDNRNRTPGGAPARGPRPPRPAGDFAPKSNVPSREFADRPRNTDAAPTVPKRTETVNDGADLPLYGRIL